MINYNSELLTRMHINFSKKFHLCAENIVDFCEHKQGDDHSSFPLYFKTTMFHSSSSYVYVPLPHPQCGIHGLCPLCLHTPHDAVPTTRLQRPNAVYNVVGGKSYAVQALLNRLYGSSSTGSDNDTNTHGLK